MALKPCSRGAVLRDSRRGIHTGTSPRGSHAHSAFACVSAMDRGRGLARPRDSHLNLRMHVGALRQQRHNHLPVAVFRGGVEERSPSMLQRSLAWQSACPTAIISRPSSLPAPAHAAWHAACRAQARPGRPPHPSLHPPPTRPPIPESACPAAAH